jgi:hypothetical protein
LAIFLLSTHIFGFAMDESIPFRGAANDYWLGLTIAELNDGFQKGIEIFDLPLLHEEFELEEPHPGEVARLLVPQELDFHHINPKTQFRFTLKEIQRLIALRMPEWFVTDNRVKIGKVEGLCLVLHRLSYPRRFSDTSFIFCRSLGVLFQLFQEVANSIYQDWKHLLLFDHVRLIPAYLRTLADTVAAKGAPLPNCFGFIDGTSIQICRPIRNQDIFYSGYKQYHAIKYQGVVNPDGMIIHLSGP